MKLSAPGPCVVRVTLLAAALGATLAACTGSLFQSKVAPPSVYLLSAKIAVTPAMATAATADPAGKTAAAVSPAIQPGVIPADLAVLRPRVRPGLESDRIAVLYPDRRLDYFADARWSGPLDEVVQDLAVQAFRLGANLRNVSVDASAFASGYWLEIEVADFQAEYASTSSAPTVRVRLLARLGGAGDRHILASFDASAQQPATDNRLSAIVDAYEQAANAALAEIVASTGHALPR
jgi:cholesterol transport system auxiliary component